VDNFSTFGVAAPFAAADSATFVSVMNNKVGDPSSTIGKNGSYATPVFSSLFLAKNATTQATRA